jgi:hypothetical protein
VLSVASVASADVIYRWHDAAGRLHYSNRTEQVPAHAQVARLPELRIVSPPPPAERRSVARLPAVRTSRSVVAPVESSTCDAADPSRLIEAITSRLSSMRPQGGDADLMLLVAGTPVWYPSDANVEVLAGGETDGAAASAQAAIAYPASGACPRTPPLERYAVASSGAAASSSLCGDYRRASEEIAIAVSRNQDVARTFRAAATYVASPPTEAEMAQGQGVVLPPWLVEATVAQTSELASETEEFLAELTVAREEIQRAAHASGCW